MFKDKLKELREREGLSQQELADRLFVSRSAIAKWENGNGLPSDVNLVAICNFFNINKKYLELNNDDLTYTKKQKYNFLKCILCFVIFDFALIVVAFFVFVDSYQDKKIYYKELLFYNDAIVIHDSQNFPLNEENIEILKERFDYVTSVMVDRFGFTINNVYKDGTGQPIYITPLSRNFVNTGVMAHDTLNFEVFSEYGPQKVDLLYGELYRDSSESYQIVIDLDTSLLCFGRKNSVGEYIKTKYGEFKVIGIVSNTIEREREKKLNDYRGRENLYHTYGYITNALAKKIIRESDFDFRFNDKIQYVIISDKNKTASEMKLIVQILFEIPKNDRYTIKTKEERYIEYTAHINEKINILYIISIVLLMLGIIGVFFIIRVLKDYKKIVIEE